MSQRESNLLWLRDTLDQMSICREQLEWAKDAETVQVLIESMLRDLDRCRRVCETIRDRVGGFQHVA
jgi:hypothetical protein